MESLFSLSITNPFCLTFIAYSAILLALWRRGCVSGPQFGWVNEHLFALGIDVPDHRAFRVIEVFQWLLSLFVAHAIAVTMVAFLLINLYTFAVGHPLGTPQHAKQDA